MQQHICRARRLWSGESADRAVITEDGAGDAVLEPSLEKIVGAHGHQVEQVIQLVADLSVAPDQAKRFAEIPKITFRRIDRRFEQKSSHVMRRLVEPGVELGVNRAIVLRETTELLSSLTDIARKDDVVIGADRAKHVGCWQHREPEFA